MKVDIPRTMFFLARETGEALKNDPALALRTGATVLQGTLLNGVQDSVRISTSNAAVPVIRTALLAANTIQCANTLKRPDASMVDKGMDIMRVVSDLAGVVGAAAMVFSPTYAKLGTTLVGAAYAADLVSPSYRGITHGEKRLRVWQLEMNQANGNPTGNTPSQPTPPPTPPAGPAKP